MKTKILNKFKAKVWRLEKVSKVGKDTYLTYRNDSNKSYNLLSLGDSTITGGSHA
jgi:hypothetical protein